MVAYYGTGNNNCTVSTVAHVRSDPKVENSFHLWCIFVSPRRQPSIKFPNEEYYSLQTGAMNGNNGSSSLTEQNSSAVACLRAGQYEEASHILLSILAQMQRNDAFERRIAEGAPSVFSVESVDVNEASTTVRRQKEDTMLSFYPRAFSVPVAPTTKHERVIAFMAFAYNLGLARHLEAIRTPSSSLYRTLLAQAGKLYESAIRTATIHIPKDPSSCIQYLLLATANNFAHVHAEYANSQEARKCISMMKNILSDPVVLRDLSEAEYSFFEVNVVSFLVAPLMSLAPAA